MRRYYPLVLLVILLCTKTLTAQDDLKVIQGNNAWLAFTDAPNALYHHFTQEAYKHLEKRRDVIANIKTRAGWQERQQWIRQKLQEIVGPFPAKTPLNARLVGTVQKEGYRIEHIVFESQPRFFVTASLYIPASLKKRTKAPAIIYCSGHAGEGYRSKVYQHVIGNLVQKGFVVFAFDPVGQGERLEYFDPETGRSTVGGPTLEHSYPGSQAFISGASQARHMIWDGIRAVDYLLTRKEIDPDRIGITGRSGGGTQSAYIAAFDERIQAAAPECYITNFTRLLQSIGPQDAEQNFPGGISSGIDHGDLLIVRAPKPALMITTTRDMFSIQGARETADEVSRIYEALGNRSDFGMVEDDAAHASTQKNREAMYAFFQRHLDNTGSSADEEVTPPTAAELRVTETGQVSSSLGGETIFSLNAAETVQKFSRMATARSQAEHEQSTVEKAIRISGYREPQQTSEAVFTGRIQRNGYAIEKYFIPGEGNYIIPYLLLKPHHPNGTTILYLHPDGKSTHANAGGDIESLITKGFAVLAPDLVGTGETGTGDFEGDAYIGGVSHNIWYSSILVGRSIAGVQASDVKRLVSVIKEKSPDERIFAIALKEMTPALLHAATFVPEIERVALLEPLISYKSLAENRIYHSGFIPTAVAGSIGNYDLPDLASSLSNRKLLMAGPVDGANNRLEYDHAAKDLAYVKQCFSSKDNASGFTLVHDVGIEALEDWLK